MATKASLESIPTFTLVFARFSLVALIFLFLRMGSKWPSFNREDHVKPVLLDKRLTAAQAGGRAMVLAAVFITSRPQGLLRKKRECNR